MRNDFKNMLLSVMGAVLLSACNSALLVDTVLRDPPRWQLAEIVLPQPHSITANQTLIFSPDGSRIVVHDARGIEVISTTPPKIITAFETEYSRKKWVKYLDNAIAYDQASNGELLLPDLTRKPLPEGTMSIRNDGRFVIVSSKIETAERSGDGVIESATGRQVCKMRVDWRMSATMSEQYAVIGHRGNAVTLCELATGKKIALHDPEGAMMSEGVLDPQGKWLLVISRQPSILGTSDSITHAKLYRLPLVPARILPSQSNDEPGIEVTPVKTWNWHTRMKAAFSPDGKWLLISSEKKSELLQTDALSDSIPLYVESKVGSIHFSRDSQWLATEDSKSIYLTKLQDTPQVTRLAIPGNPENFSVTDIAPDGSAFIGIMSPKLTDTPKRILWRIEASPK